MRRMSRGIVVMALLMGGAIPAAGDAESFGTLPDGRAVMVYTLEAGPLRARVMDYGATLLSLEVPDRNGERDDIVLGFDSLDQYVAHSPYFGATCGRVANRIAEGKFTLDGQEYTLATNNAPNHLHGGTVGFDKVIWKVAPEYDADAPALVFTYLSPDREEGYPGNLLSTVTYRLSADALTIEYSAVTDAATPINLTHHSYFNLAGEGSRSVLDHVVFLNASRYTPVDETLIPTGELAPVFETPFDFTTPTTIGKRIRKAGGYDHNYVLDRVDDTSLSLAARVHEPESGRVMEIYTTEPGVQFYTGNFLDGTFAGKAGKKYDKHAGFCLETQHFPDSINQPQFPSVVLRPGETYRHVTVHRFTTR